MWVSDQLLRSLAGVLVETSDSVLAELQMFERVFGPSRRRKLRRQMDDVRRRAWTPLVLQAADEDFIFETCDFSESLHVEALGGESVSGLRVIQSMVNN